MRLLVVGGNPILGWIVRHLVPQEVAVESATNLWDAREVLLDRPPDAVLIQVMPKPCPCRQVVALCQRQRPPIPTLFYAGAYLDPCELDVPARRGDLAIEPSDLRRRLDRLIHTLQDRPDAAVGSGAAPG